MDKCRYIGDLSQKDAPEILQAYPEEEPILEQEISDDNQKLSTRPSQVVPLMKSLPKQKLDTASPMTTGTNRYYMRSRV